MPLFKYKAAKADGKEYTETKEAPDKFALYKEIQKKGESVISVKEIEKGKGFNLSFSIGGVKMEHKIMFARNLSAMLVAGLPLSRAIGVLSRQIESKKFKDVLQSLQEDLTKGVAFSQALKAHPEVFSTLFSSMVAAGEEGGNISGALKVVSEQMEKTYLLKKKVRGAMMYPGIIFGVMIIIAVLMFVYVVPKLTATFREFNVELPLATRVVLGTSDLLSNHFILVIIGAAALGAGFFFFVKSNKGRRIFDALTLKLPVIGPIAKEVNSARMSRTLSSLLSSGVDVVGAVKITADVVQNTKYKDMLSTAAEDIQKGILLSELFSKREDIYPIFVGEMISVGEETGTLSKTLFDVAAFYEGEVEQKTKDLSTVIEPFLMVFIGAAVGFFALAMISPIYSLSNNL